LNLLAIISIVAFTGGPTCAHTDLQIIHYQLTSTEIL